MAVTKSQILGEWSRFPLPWSRVTRLQDMSNLSSIGTAFIRYSSTDASRIPQASQKPVKLWRRAIRVRFNQVRSSSRFNGICISRNVISLSHKMKTKPRIPPSRTILLLAFPSTIKEYSLDWQIGRHGPSHSDCVAKLDNPLDLLPWYRYRSSKVP